MNAAELERFRQLCADEPTPGVWCAVCGAERRPERAKRYAGEAARLDPFCSSACARSYHGTTLRPLTTGPRDGGELVPSNHARVECRACGGVVATVQRGGTGPAFFPPCPRCGERDPAGPRAA